ncbi:hypothetical protein, partial [Liquorilactobacillus satsumensis]|uniref:hypothetical protein n=1 Tax=Liquorilactobacillus satsumensis TaxID=259059 RepID=UPI0039E781CD
MPYALMVIISSKLNNILAINETSAAGLKSCNIFFKIYSNFTCVMILCGLFKQLYTLFNQCPYLIHHAIG